MYTLKEATLIPPDGKIVFSVPIDMEWITVVISDPAGNVMLKMPIERKDNLISGKIVRTYWDGRFVGYKGKGTGQWFRADPAKGNYYYTVIGEEKVAPRFEQLPVVTPEELPSPLEVFEQPEQPSQMPTWLWVVIGVGVLLLLTKRTD